jgi:hypothetical protein
MVSMKGTVSMKMTTTTRTKRGWTKVQVVICDPVEVAALRKATAMKVEAGKAAGKDFFNSFKIGETVYLKASGTLSELYEAGCKI